MKKTAKLKLSRETVGLLNATDLTQAQGQQPTTLIGCRTLTCHFSCGGTCDINCVAPTTTLYC